MKAKQRLCDDCEKQINKNELALCKKLLGLETDEFYCIHCLAVYLGCDEDDLHIKINEFKEQGCTLFL